MGDVETVLNFIKDYLPSHLHITKENLLHPTSEIVVQVYSCLINEYNESIYYLTGVQMPNDMSEDLEPDERLFKQLRKLLEIQSVKCTLSDINAPTAMRTKNFLKLCVHFIAFVQNVLNCERDIIANDVFKTKEDTNKLIIEKEELLNEINENAINKELHERNKNLLEQEYESTKNAYKKMKELKASKEKICAEKKQQIDTLKWEMENEKHELERLETIKKDLLQQKITEKDYQNILQTVEALKTESEMFHSDDVNMGDGLVQEKELLQRTADCLRIRDRFDFRVLKNVKDLINKKEELKVVSNSVEKLNGTKLNYIQKKPEGERKLLLLQEDFVTLQNEHKDIKELYTHNIKQFSLEIVRCKNEIEEKSQNDTQVILKYKDDVKKLEEDKEKLRKAFTNGYIKVSKVESRVVDNFRDMLTKCSDFS